MHSTSIIILFLLRIKGLTQRCYVWSDKDYKIVLVFRPSVWDAIRIWLHAHTPSLAIVTVISLHFSLTSTAANLRSSLDLDHFCYLASYDLYKLFNTS